LVAAVPFALSTRSTTATTALAATWTECTPARSCCRIARAVAGPRALRCGSCKSKSGARGVCSIRINTSPITVISNRVFIAVSCGAGAALLP
jgi:hypothetical protein